MLIPGEGKSCVNLACAFPPSDDRPMGTSNVANSAGSVVTVVNRTSAACSFIPYASDGLPCLTASGQLSPPGKNKAIPPLFPDEKNRPSARLQGVSSGLRCQRISS